ncbi:MAG TPA: host attachment protein [Steroidobacteraceae bacterium]|nr:host attachment protein [Steroidobacteraceae bacterium]
MAVRADAPVCVVVADQSEARVYLLRGAAIRVAASLENTAARLHDRDLKSDRPGRVYDRAPPARGRRGAGTHHATGGERTPRRQVADRFARDVAAAVSAARRSARFDRLVLVAAPRFLGMLRRSLPGALRAQVVAEYAKDWVNLPTAKLRVRMATAARRARRQP